MTTQGETNMGTALNELREHLRNATPGGLNGDRLLPEILANCWDELHPAESTSADKLYRLEQRVWQPPILTFVLERHGATCLGSSRAALHKWTVEISSGVALCDSSFSSRQLGSADERLDVRTPAQEVASAIRALAEDPRLKWAK